jgi:hypothetical protein
MALRLGSRIIKEQVFGTRQTRPPKKLRDLYSGLDVLRTNSKDDLAKLLADIG